MITRLSSFAAIIICTAALSAPARAQDVSGAGSQSGTCTAAGNSLADALAGPAWNGWGVSARNSRFQPAGAAGLSAEDVPRLRLKWAFGFPNTSEASAQPAVAGGRVFVGSWAGEVYSLDAKTGCTYWSIETKAAVRTAVTLGEAAGGGLTAYFGDQAANVYAVDAATGKLLWTVKIDDHPVAKVTGSPALHEGRLYVPVASGEEAEAANPQYECCTFRGSIVALNAATGQQIWKRYLIADAPRRTEKNPAGAERWGPSGAAVWSAPTIDVRQKALYVGTGNNYSPPARPTSDAIVALDLESGKIRWAQQLEKDDTWNTSCPDRARDHSNCPDLDDPDFDFGASPILVELGGGRRALVAGQKSGLVYGLDPDRKGKILWEQRVAKGGTQGGVLWGPAADPDTAYVAVSDAMRLPGTNEFDPTIGGGLVAIDLKTGTKRWTAPPVPCREQKSCSPAQVAAVTVIPGVVFSGSADGFLRAYSARDGKIIWNYDTVREYTTVNGVKAKGGTINGAGVAVVGGTVFTNSGYNHITGIYPGNVLLAFSAE